VGGTGHKPIAPQRGLPTDLDPESCTDDDHDSCFGGADEFGERCRSWLTLAELRSHDWSDLSSGQDGETHRTDACEKFLAWLERQDAPVDDLRIVFGFDH
jgi:hypothetical protein